jgi:hypothetical protein
MRGSPAILIAATIFLSSQPALSNIGILECSAVFKARADWIEGTGGNTITVEMMRSRAELAFQVYVDSLIDEKMVRGSPRPEDKRDALALALLTRVVEQYHPTAVVMPTCMEEPTCTLCSDMLSKYLRIDGR